MQSSCAHDALHFTAQALRAREKRAVVLPRAFGLLALVAGCGRAPKAFPKRAPKGFRRFGAKLFYLTRQQLALLKSLLYSDR